MMLNQRQWRPATPAALDAAFPEYNEELWQTGEARAIAEDTLSGITHYVPQIRRHIRGSWRLLTA